MTINEKRNTSVRLEPLTETKAMRGTPCADCKFRSFRFVCWLFARAKSINKRTNERKNTRTEPQNRRRQHGVCVGLLRADRDTLSLCMVLPFGSRHSEIRIGKPMAWHVAGVATVCWWNSWARLSLTLPSCRMVVAFGCLFLVSRASLHCTSAPQDS